MRWDGDDPFLPSQELLTAEDARRCRSASTAPPRLWLPLLRSASQPPRRWKPLTSRPQLLCVHHPPLQYSLWTSIPAAPSLLPSTLFPSLALLPLCSVSIHSPPHVHRRSASLTSLPQKPQPLSGTVNFFSNLFGGGGGAKPAAASPAAAAGGSAINTKIPSNWVQGKDYGRIHPPSRHALNHAHGRAVTDGPSD